MILEPKKVKSVTVSIVSSTICLSPKKSPPIAVPGEYFTCSFIRVTVRKVQRDAHNQLIVFSPLFHRPIIASIMMTHTLNRVNLGVDTIAKNLNNIFLYPEEKYHKIQVQNKMFQECINCLEGRHMFLSFQGLPGEDASDFQPRVSPKNSVC